VTEKTNEGYELRGNEYLREDSVARAHFLEMARSADRREALLADPSLAAGASSGGEFTDQEVRDLKRSVLQARRLREVEQAPSEPISNRLSGLAAAMTICLLFVLPSSLERAPDSEAPNPSSGSRPAPAAMTHSSVEALGLPGARVYELADEDFSLVLVVDESFEL
jgi:hypothetical protein